MDGRIFHLRARIVEKLSHDWTVEEMATIVYLSPPHIHRLFKLHAGIPPIQFVRELRLEAAREMMEGSFLQMKQIGQLVGIASESHLTKGFKQKFGVSPTDYRKHHWEKVQKDELKCKE
jgi:transcriptional regulator GlxA family with amidase domain